MRTSLAILALALGCFGCHDKQSSISQTVTAVPAPEPGERPSFYDSNNIAEHYGRCPKCQHWVKGYITHEDYADASGKLVGGGSLVAGMCERCRVHLGADALSALTNDSRIITWSLR